MYILINWLNAKKLWKLASFNLLSLSNEQPKTQRFLNFYKT